MTIQQDQNETDPWWFAPLLYAGAAIVIAAFVLAQLLLGDATRPATFQAVYVNFLLIIVAILVVIFSIWGYHQLK